MRLRDCFGAINTVAHFDRVQIDFHDALLSPYPFDQDGEVGFYPLAQIGLSGPEEYILGCLLRDCAGAAYTFAFLGIGTGFLDLCHIEPVMIEKEVVFRSDNRLRQRLGDLFHRNPLMLQLKGLAVLKLLIHPDKHQRSIIDRNKLISHDSQQTGYKQEQQQVPAPY